MPPRIDFFAASRPLTYRPKALNCPRRAQQALKTLPASCRGFANSNDLPIAEGAEGPNTDTLPHVSEEAAAINEITGKGGPEIEQGTPVQEVRVYQMPVEVSETAGFMRSPCAYWRSAGRQG